MTDQIHNDRYQGNPNLKRSNVNIEYTEEQISEFVKCAHDCRYFIEKYVQIVHIDRGLVPFDLYPFQSKMVESFVNNRFVINKLPRQSGKSTTVTAYMLWKILFHDNQNIAILANRGVLARELLSKITMAYEYLPIWLQQGVITWNRGNIELENGSKIVAAATSASSIRGGSYNLIFLDEFAFVEAYLAEQFFASVYPTISSGKTSQVIIVSTPNGLNHFYKMWVDAEEERSSYKSIEVHWTEVPGRDEEWKKETIANTSEEQFRQEFECEFIGSTNTLIAASKLRNMPFKTPISQHGSVDVFEEPKENHTYTMTVDVSRGLNLDYSVFSVIDVTQLPYKQVAKFRDNQISPMVFPSAIVNAARYYNSAFILVEVNDIGQQVADIIHHELEYENILTTVAKGRAGQQISGGYSRNAQFGVKTTKQVKGIGCTSLKTLVEQDQLLIEDFHTIAELAGFVQKGQSYEAEAGQHDDLAMTLVLFAWLTNQTYFKDITDINIREKIYKLQEQQMEEAVLPFGVIDDGQDETFVDNTGQVWTNSDMGSSDTNYENDFKW